MESTSLSSDALVSCGVEWGRQQEKNLQEVCCEILPISPGPQLSCVNDVRCGRGDIWSGMCGLMELKQKCVYVCTYLMLESSRQKRNNFLIAGRVV